MLDLPTAEELKKTQDIITAIPKGPWEVESPDAGRLPDQVGPVAFLETWVDSDRVPVLLFIEHAREALPRYMGAVARLMAENAALKRRIEGGRP